MKSLVPWFCLVAAASSHVLYAADGIESYRLGNYTLAAKGLTASDPVTQYYLGLMRLYGYGQLKNNTLALQLFTQAADRGYLPAQQLLARFYLNEMHDPEKAFEWFKKSAAMQDLPAQLYTAATYLYGYGVKKNSDMATRYLIDAAKSGNALAQYALAMQFLESRDSRNKKMGVIWLNKAADKNQPKALFQLGEIYSEGKLVKRDPIKAKELYEQAANNGSHDGQIALAKIYRDVEKDELKAADWDKAALKTATDAPSAPDAQVSVARWLSNDKDNTFAFGNYHLGGIYNAWQNAYALKQNNYNQAPLVATLTRQELYKPNFVMVNPKSIPINDYFNSIAPTLGNNTDGNLVYPRYKLDKEVAALLRDESLVLQHDSNLPLVYRNTLHTPDEMNTSFDYMAEKTADAEHQANFQAVLSRLYGQAILGESASQFQLGQLYQYGVVVAKNVDQAITYFQLAAAQQDVRAEYNLGILYLEGKTNPVDYQKGVQWLTDAAFKGNAYAQYVLANLYETGLKDSQGVMVLQPDHQQAIAMYYLASSNNYAPAEYRLADYLVKEKKVGLNVVAQQNRNKLIKRLYQGAAKRGVAEAILPLAFYDAMDSDIDKQHQAFRIAEREAKAGNSEAALLLGMMYERGIATEANDVEAMKWYQQATINPVNAFILGTYYTTGSGLTKDVQKGKELLQQSADGGFPYANLNLAILQKQNGQEFLTELDKARQLGNSKAGLLLADYYLLEAQDPEKMKQAASIYQYFAEKGDKDAQMKLGFLFDKGLGGELNNERAAYWYHLSAEQGQPIAQYLLGQLYQMGRGEKIPDYAQAKKWYQAALTNYPKAAIALGFLNETIDNDYSSAEKNYQLAAQTGESLGQFNLGLISEYGKGVSVDELRAKEYYLEAAQKDYPAAMTRLADLYFKGINGERREQEAITWYQKAAKLGDRGALYQLGLLSETGVGLSVNYADAVNFYQQAADLGHEKAQLALARMYEHGLGVTKDPQHAADIYKKLAANNNAYAQYQLAIMYMNGALGEPQLAQGKLLLQKASNTGSQQARNLMQWLGAQQEMRLSFIEPVDINRSAVFLEQTADLMYLDALNEWNRGDESASRMILDKLLTQYPNYEPARRAYQQLNQQIKPLIS